MHWGRSPRKSESDRIRPASDSLFTPGNAVILLGTLLCLLFFCLAVTGERTISDYPADRAAAAWESFGREHTALTAVLGIDEYFPDDAVSAGAFPRQPERWNFRDYMRDALTNFVFGEKP